MQTQDISPNEKEVLLSTLLKVINRATEYKCIERSFIDYIKNIRTLDFIADPEGTWTKIYSMYHSSQLMRSIVLLLRYYSKNPRYIVKLCKNLVLVAQKEITIQLRQEELVQRTLMKINLLSFIMGLSLGALLATFFFTSIATTFGYKNKPTDMFLILTITSACIILALTKIFFTLNLFVGNAYVEKQNIRRPIILFVISLITSFFSIYALMGH